MPETDLPAIRPAIDYTNKDYASLRQALLDLAAYRVPEWTDRSPADLGVLLVDLFAYMGDVLLYYQDRIASELFLHTATERKNVIQLLRLIGYELKPPVAAAAALTLTFNPAGAGQPATVTVPRGAQFATKPQGGAPEVVFEYLGPDVQVDRSRSLILTGLSVRQCVSTAHEILGSATGEPNQRFKLAGKPVIPESVVVEVDPGAGFRQWNRRENLLYYVGGDGRVQLAGPDSDDFFLEVGAEGDVWVCFGDGVYGRRPVRGNQNVRASYRVGGGSAGNVPASTITAAKTRIQNLKSVTNPFPAAGGTDPETIEHAIQFAPVAFRSSGRAVTLYDYVALAQQAGGVAKVRAASRGWNRVDLYVAPVGETVTPAPLDLKRRLVAWFEDKRMVGTFVYIQDPRRANVTVEVSILVEHHWDPALVRQRVLEQLRQLLSYANMDFGKVLYLSKIYETVEAVAGVEAATVRRFQRSGVAQPAIPADGRIVAGEFEIPVLDQLTVTVEGQAA